MEREYDLFEQFPDGLPMWRGHALGLGNARLTLERIANATNNECFAVHLPTKEIVARLNVRVPRGGVRKPLIFQIAYDGKLALARTEILRLHGYEVVFVIGNEAAKVVLGMPQHFDLFIVGHAAAEAIRREMVAWLRTNYSDVRILALNPPGIRELVGADYNVELNDPEVWVHVVGSALQGRDQGESLQGH